MEYMNSMHRLDSSQRKYLRGLAHRLKPVVLIGQKGLTGGVAQSIDQALEAHELVKVKFIDLKEKGLKEAIALEIEQKMECQSVGAIGHTVILYRRQSQPEKRRIALPAAREDEGAKG